MDISTQAGISPIEFWKMTPSEISSVIQSFNQKLKYEHDNSITLAYLTAYWHRVKKMPKLKDLLSDKKQQKRQTANDMLNEIKKINAALGGNVT